MTTRYITLLIVALGFITLQAQNPPLPTSYRVQFYQNLTGGSPIASTLLPSTSYTCNVLPSTPVAAAPVVTASWDDPVNVGRECRYQDPGSGGFVTSPAGVRVYVSIAGGVVWPSDGLIHYGDESTPRIEWINRTVPGPVPGFRIRGGAAVIAGVIGDIIPNWATPNQPTWRIVNMSGPFGPFQMMVGSPDGRITLPEFGEVRRGMPYELTIVAPQ